MMNVSSMFARIVLISLLFLAACSPEKSRLQIQTPTPVPTENPKFDPQLNICSKLDLSSVVWPAELTASEWSYYALGLNITGSFEGREGWKNITGNFDGQGLSLGLMQQNLGQGTLQPLLIGMFKQYNNTLMQNFSFTDYKSMQTMLETWLNNPINTSALLELEKEELFPKETFNKLDIGFEHDFMAVGDSGKSVLWAQKTILDSSGYVLPKWKTSFQNMAISSGYRSFQIAASTKIFNKAKQYFKFFNFSELRFLLFFFDIVVQNGSINEQHLAEYNIWLSGHTSASEQERALALLEIRLKTVRPQYVADVRSRKSAIIYGTGIVHKTQRDFPKEYCFDPNILVE